jgi:hypothetical protein
LLEDCLASLENQQEALSRVYFDPERLASSDESALPIDNSATAFDVSQRHGAPKLQSADLGSEMIRPTLVELDKVVIGLALIGRGCSVTALMATSGAPSSPVE